MNLIEHVKAQGGTGTATCPLMAQIARRAECSAATLYMIALGHKKASAVLARRIAEATSHAVTVHDLREDIFGPRSSDEAA